MLDGITHACVMAAPSVAKGEPPRDGDALRAYVDAHAQLLRGRDTPAFRRELLEHVAGDRDPRLCRYWQLAGEIDPVLGHGARTWCWLHSALEQSIVN